MIAIDDKTKKQVKDAVDKAKDLWCWFCGKSRAEVCHMVVSDRAPKPAICNECVSLCNEFMAEAHNSMLHCGRSHK